MVYVLDRIADMSKNFHQNTSITVNITFNQIIKYQHRYKFASSFPLSIRLIGHNNTSIEVKNMSYLVIYQEYKSESEFNWAWIGFTIFKHIHPDIQKSITHINMNYLVIHNCKIMTIESLVITGARNAVINSTEFT